MIASECMRRALSLLMISRLNSTAAAAATDIQLVWDDGLAHTWRRQHFADSNCLVLCVSTTHTHSLNTNNSQFRESTTTATTCSDADFWEKVVCTRDDCESTSCVSPCALGTIQLKAVGDFENNDTNKLTAECAWSANASEIFYSLCVHWNIYIYKHTDCIQLSLTVSLFNLSLAFSSVGSFAGFCCCCCCLRRTSCTSQVTSAISLTSSLYCCWWKTRTHLDREYN